MARAGDGSMRDAQSAFDQVIAFAGDDDRRRRRRDGARPRAARPAVRHRRRGRARGWRRGVRARRPRRRVRLRPAARRPRAGAPDARPAGRRASIRRGRPIPEIAAEGERERLTALATRFSAEDLMRAFDVLTKAEVRHPRLDAAALPPRDGAPALDPPAQAGAAQRSDPGPRDQAPAVRTAPRSASGPPLRRHDPRRHRRAVRAPRRDRRSARRSGEREAGPSQAATRRAAALDRRAGAAEQRADLRRAEGSVPRRGRRRRRSSSTARSSRRRSASTSSAIAIVFTFAPQHRALRDQLEQVAPGLEELASQLAGTKMTVVVRRGTGVAADSRARPRPPRTAPDQDRQSRTAAAGAGRHRRPGDARRVRGGDQGCGGDESQRRFQIPVRPSQRT